MDGPAPMRANCRVCMATPLLAAVTLLFRTVTANLPYDPTTVFLSKSNSDHLYIIEPPSDTSPKGRLALVDTTAKLSSSSLKPVTVSDSLPFLEDASVGAWSSLLDEDGSILVYAGDCSAAAAGASLWRFTPSNNGKGSWEKQSFNAVNVAPGQPLTGANFLSSGIAFSANQTEKDSDLHFFGGMCPTTSSTDSTWTSAATYSDKTLLFQHDTSTDYDFILIPGQGQPIPEAGFTLTPLQPSYSPSGAGSASKSQDVLLLGGHTQTAFINMTRVALFSLPATTWSFVDINPPEDKTDLKPKRDLSTIEPRSGHTAVLTADGSQVLIFGGWVGDVTTAAVPQLAILNIGLGYGGSGAWEWSIPSTNSLPFGDGEGIYGHGAVMLPGNVMMVTGGYDITAGSSSKSKRAMQTQSSSNMFFNVTSGKWMNSYDPRLAPQSTQSSHSSHSSGLDSSQKAGIGVGVALGVLALILAIVIGCAYSRRLKRKREAEERDMQEKEDNEYEEPLRGVPYEAMTYADGRDPSIDGRGGSRAASSVWNSRSREMEEVYPWSSNPLENYASQGGWKRGHDTERSGIDLNLPSPNRGLRRSAYGRGQYQSAPRFEDGRLMRNNMHAIQEMDEDQSSASSSRKPSQAQRPNVEAKDDTLNPFRDPSPDNAGEGPSRPKAIKRKPVGSSQQAETVSQAEERQREMSGWIRDWSAAQAILHGRGSDKSDRTHSNLSDGSTRSAVSSRSKSSAAGSGTAGPSRAPSARSYLPSILPAILHPFFYPNAISPTKDSSSSSDDLSHSTTSRPDTSHRNDADSFATARSNVSLNQGESETLLVRNKASQPNLRREIDAEPGSAQNNSPLRSHANSIGRLGGWVGSVKRAVPRVLSNTGRSSSMTATILKPGGIGADGFPEYTSEQRSGSSSPTKRRPLTTFIPQDARPQMRRSASDGADFLAMKRGAKDWDDDDEAGPSDRAATMSGAPQSGLGERGLLTPRELKRASLGVSSTYGGVDGDDWDVEAAVEERCVQLMFTVPRERLRVVNADVDALSTSDMGDVGVDRLTEVTGNEQERSILATVEKELV